MRTSDIPASAALAAHHDATASTTGVSAATHGRTERPRTLVTIALLFATAALGVAIYGNLVSLPGWVAAHAEAMRREAGGGLDSMVSWDAADAYSKTVGFQALGTFGLALVSVILGIVGLVKRRGPLAALAIGLAVVAVPLAIRLTQAM